LDILSTLSVPIEKPPRQLERMALAFLGIAGITPSNYRWEKLKDFTDRRFLTSRDIIDFMNQHYNERLSRGSYDDIRRKDLNHLVLASIAISSKPNSARNDPSRAY